MIVPKYLTKGSTVAIAAPARSISKEEIAFAEKMLSDTGFNVFYDDRLFGIDGQYAGSDTMRTQYFQELLDNPDIDAVLCARGGYGSVRIIDSLDFRKFSDNPKWICGYSDITVLHSHIRRNLGISTIHSTMPINITADSDQKAFSTLVSALKGEPLEYAIPDHPLSKPGAFSGAITGGNISVLYSLLGSPSDINTDQQILLIEDLDEYLYHIDRMMMNLKRNGKLKNLKAVLVGHLNKMHDNTIPFGKTAEEIVAEHCHGYDYPVIFNVPAGHLSNNYTFRLGTATEGFYNDKIFTIKNLSYV